MATFIVSVFHERPCTSRKTPASLSAAPATLMAVVLFWSKTDTKFDLNLLQKTKPRVEIQGNGLKNLTPRNLEKIHLQECKKRSILIKLKSSWGRFFAWVPSPSYVIQKWAKNTNLRRRFTLDDALKFDGRALWHRFVGKRLHKRRVFAFLFENNVRRFRVQRWQRFDDYVGEALGFSDAVDRPNRVQSFIRRLGVSNSQLNVAVFVPRKLQILEQNLNLK